MQKLVSGRAILPPILECVRDVNSTLPDNFTLDPSDVPREKNAKLVNTIAETLRALLAVA